MAGDLIPVVLGEKWIAVMPLFRVFCIYALTHSVEVLLPPVLFARYRSGFLLKWTIGLLVVMPAPFMIGAKWDGAMGVALALILVYPCATIWMAREALKELDLRAVELLRHVLPVAVPTVLMIFSVVAVQWGFPAGEFWQHLIRLLAATIVGIAVYGSAVSLMRRPLAKEVLEVMGWVLRRNPTVGLSRVGVPVP